MRFAVAALMSVAVPLAVPALAQGSDAPIVSPVLASEEAHDPWTFAEPETARVTHVALDLTLDFADKRVAGTATLDVQARPGAKTVVLDSQGLEIASVKDEAGRDLPFAVGEAVEGKGAPITVTLDGARQIAIAYSVPQAAALQWLAPEQTAGGEHPYLFSQGQPTLNRTWIPTQDSPGIRQTWEARIVAPKPLTVVMSGLRQGEPEDLGDGTRAFRFAMDKPVAPYLIAIAAGDIAFRELGPRNRELLEKRDRLQARIDDWLQAHRGQPYDIAASRRFLEEIGYLVPEGPPFSVTTARRASCRLRRHAHRAALALVLACTVRSPARRTVSMSESREKR